MSGRAGLEREAEAAILDGQLRAGKRLGFLPRPAAGHDEVSGARRQPAPGGNALKGHLGRQVMLGEAGDSQDDLIPVATLPALEQLLALAGETSPDLRAAQEALHQEEFGVSVARSAYLPSLSFDYFFGINANQFATHDQEGHNLLGSVAQATLNIPVFNWWTTRSRIRQAELKRQQAQLDLTLTQRELVSNLRSSYLEARSALAQLNSLKQSLDLSAESLRLTNLRYEAGEVTVLEVVDAQSTLAQARNTYDDGLSRYRLALANLQTLTGNY